jgi:DNA-binding NarL/FixJ family response regulator
VLARTEVDLARSWGAPRPLGRALRILATLGGAAGIDSLREAVALLEDSPARLERAHALAALGAAVRRAGRRAEARDLLGRALELAHATGAHALEAHVREELLVAGARPRRVRLHGVDALTASELRVAQLAAAGKANKEIAQALFVALKTVEMHLASVYRKLGIRSRTELTTMLAPGT